MTTEQTSDRRQPLRGISCLVPGTNWHIDSGLGGHSEVEYLGRESGGRLAFRYTRDYAMFSLSEAEALQSIHTVRSLLDSL